MTAGLALMKNIIKLLAKSVSILFELTAALSATDAAIQKKILGSGTTTVINSNKEIEKVMKIIKSLKKSGWLIKGITETIKNDAREQKVGFFPKLWHTLPASFLGSALTEQGVTRTGEGTVIAVQNF